MCSLLLPAIASSFVEDFEEVAYKPFVGSIMLMTQS
jgi:hypothetical protein